MPDDERREEAEDERRTARAAAFEQNQPQAIPVPMNWQALAPDEMPDAWDELRAWVERLVKRYPHLDHHYIPPCWFRHNEHVEALVALRDFEMLAFFPMSPATSPYNFQIALSQIEVRLRDWTTRAGCRLDEHYAQQPTVLCSPSDAEWAVHIAFDMQRREQYEEDGTVQARLGRFAQEEERGR